MSDRHGSRSIAPLTIAALGVVYGDIGTSPLYAIRECFFGSHSVAPTPDNILGVLSLIIYSLLFVVSFKYVAIVLRADNRGEGGVLALTALLPPGSKGLLLAGLVGAALLYGDGMITPAITVLGSIEGLTVITPLFEPYVAPISVGILLGVFSIQKHGTHQVGRLFGPVMVVWFVTLAALGVRWTMEAPMVLGAIDPRHALTFFGTHGWHALAVLGAVFLVVTGGEALYADMGHFGRRPIRLAWFGLVMPALLLNYFGQGALLLTDPTAASQPFFRMAPSWALFPLVVLATAAAIIASQALISGAFSLTQQAVQLGYVPRLDIRHTSRDTMGQIYVPDVNWALMLCTIAIVIGFGSSSALAAAYGIAVTLTMIITALLLHTVMVTRWHWSPVLATVTVAAFLIVDVAFFAANALKIAHGGWLPLLVALVLFTLMTTWKTGRRIVFERLAARITPLDEFLAGVRANPPARVPGTAVFMTAQGKGAPPALTHNLQHNKVLHSQVLTLSVSTQPIPHVPPAERVSVRALGDGVAEVTLRYGFMDDPNIPAALAEGKPQGLPDPEGDVTYFLGRETLLVTDRPGMARWRERLFVLMSRNAVRAVTFFRLPPERVVELGIQVEL